MKVAFPLTLAHPDLWHATPRFQQQQPTTATNEGHMYWSFESFRSKAASSMRCGSRRLAVVALLSVAALLLAACGSSSSSPTPTTSSTTAQHTPGRGNGSGSGGGAGSGLANGVTVTVKAVSGDQITVTTKVGRTKTVLVGSTTTITQNGTTTSLSAVKAGETVLVKGHLNSSGAIVATSLAIQP
ncbi:hypothetical protein SAMN02745225_02245 [Ferrithrix thermotolerans DSM 19514]|uniref:DUF5666 domain-containing protein n=1 Tax=Ferrithrix thermotolerans DSM 19514 TaxID=1121881 RepID=A0A1M4Y680_9ACTN|nr:hypothetical protein SAMN02745225_02245 [Ferrithrix thermotolerans DSM 19514]